jgi:hypothetical protein
MFKHLDIMTRRRLRQIAWAIGKAVDKLPADRETQDRALYALALYAAVIVGALS